MKEQNFRIIYDDAELYDERPAEYHAMSGKIYNEVTSKKTPNLEKVERFFQRWKQYPGVWTWLHQTLKKHNREADARKCLDKLIELFPDYFYGKLIQAIEFIEEKKYEEARSILGEQPDITLMMLNKTEFFYEDVLKYYAAYLDLELAFGNEEIAQELIAKAISVDGEKNTIVEIMQKKLYMHRMKGFYDRMEKWKEMELRPEYVDRNDYDSYVSQPFNHIEVQAIYEGSFDPEKENIDEILSLPRETLIKDLENIILKSIYERSEDSDYNAIAYTIYFLTELKSIESYPVILQMLKQGDEYREFWFSDALEDICVQLLYLLILTYPEELKTYVKEPNLDASFKAIVFSAQELVVANFPEKRDAVLDWFKDVLDFYYKEKDNRDIIDTMLNGLIEHSILDLNFKELLPVLETFHAENLIDEMSCGDIETVRKEFDMEEKEIDYRLRDIYEFFEQEKQWEKNWENNDDVNKDNKNSPSNNFLENKDDKQKDTNPKVGRNDPCPCGSGKKYKKCCGK